MLRVGTLAAVLALAGLTAASALPASGAARACSSTTKINFQLDIAPDGRHAPWYAAQQLGFYKDACLDVNIVPGTGSGAATTNTASGTVQASFLDLVGVLVAKDANHSTPLVYGATIYAHAPYAIFSYTPGYSIKKPADISGKDIGCPATSALCPLTQAWSQGKGYGTISFRDVPQANEFALFKAGQIPAIVTYNLTRPVLETPGKQLNMLLMSDYGLDPFLGNGIVFNANWAMSHKAAAQAFVAASLKGFEWVMKHEDQAVDLLTGIFPTIDANVATRQLNTESALLASSSAATLGCVSDAAAKATVNFAVKGLSLPAIDTRLLLWSHAFEPKTCASATTTTKNPVKKPAPTKHKKAKK